MKKITFFILFAANFCFAQTPIDLRKSVADG